MSQPELVEAYRSGRIGRRVFVKGLVGLGMSVSVATAMADRVRAQDSTPVATVTPDDVYTPTPVVDDPVTTLPNTGAADSGNSAGMIGKTMVIAGAGLAAVAAFVHRKSKQDGATNE
ncbi:hypothetical protein BH09CHL1_BH09CHL1_06090 [soil metagenome]